MMKKHNDHKISEILDQLIETPKIRSGYYKVSIEEAWNALMGKTIETYTDSIYFRDGRLIIKLSSAPLKHELSMAKPKMISLLNEKLGKEVVREIIIK